MGGLFGPKPPKPSVVAEAQVGQNKMAGEQLFSSMPNQQGVGVSQTWGFGGVDPVTGMRRPEVITNLSPENQALYGGELVNRGMLGGGLTNLIGNYLPQMTQPFNATQEGMNATLGGAGIANLVGEQFWGPQRQWQQNQLVNQGLAGLSPRGLPNIAHDQATKQLGQNQFMQFLSSVMPWQKAMADQATTSRNTNFSNIGQLLDSSGPSIPVGLGTFSGFTPQPPNMAQIYQNNFEQEKARADAIGKFIANVAGTAMGMPMGNMTLGAVAGQGLSSIMGSMSSPWTQPGYVPSPLMYGS